MLKPRPNSILIVILMVLATTILGPAQQSQASDVDVSEGDGTGDGTYDTVTLGATDGTDTTKKSDDIETTTTANSESSPSAPTDPMAGLGQSQEEQYCGWADLPEQLPANDPAWNGHSPDEGSLKWRSCAVLFPGAPGGPGNLEGRPVIYAFVPNGAPVATPPLIDPAILAQRAVRELAIPIPVMNTGPDRSKLAVNLWTWLWVDDPGQLSATVAAGAVSVTATATLSSVTWTLGEPATDGDTYQQGTPATITCQGAGTAPPTNYDWKAQPPCGYQFHWRSLKERTGGTGTWPITATTNWTVTWQSNTGVTGGTTLNASSNDQFDVGEYRTVLVEGDGGG